MRRTFDVDDTEMITCSTATFDIVLDVEIWHKHKRYHRRKSRSRGALLTRTLLDFLSSAVAWANYLGNTRSRRNCMFTAAPLLNKGGTNSSE